MYKCVYIMFTLFIVDNNENAFILKLKTDISREWCNIFISSKRQKHFELCDPFTGKISCPVSISCSGTFNLKINLYG